MFGNIIVLLIILALAVLFAWLTWRAVRARKLWLKIAGGLGAGLLTLLFVVVAFLGAKGLLAMYAPGAPEPRQITVAGTPEQIARGEYLVDISCVACHGAPTADNQMTAEHPLSGGFNLSKFEGFDFIGDLIAENLTPGGKLAGYTDGELFRVMRHGVDQDGRALALMSLLPYNQLSDADTEAIIAYLRSLPAAETDLETGSQLNFIGAVMLSAGMFGPGREPAPETIAALPQAETPEFGKYVATFGECRGCHGPDMTGAEATAVSAAVPNPRPLAGALSQAEFVEMMRSGVRPGNNPFPPTMPFENAAKMTDTDLAALYAYLTAAP
jgi:mono/diheme cytochrome c family protein